MELELELAGKITSTTFSIRAGVYEAMVNALESFSGGGNGQNTEVKVYLEGDSKKLFKVIRTEGQDYQKSTGKPVFE